MADKLAEVKDDQNLYQDLHNTFLSETSGDPDSSFDKWYEDNFFYYFDRDYVFDDWYKDKHNGESFENYVPDKDKIDEFLSDYDNFEAWFNTSFFENEWYNNLSAKWEVYWCEQNGYAKGFDFNGSYPLQIYEVDKENKTLVRVSADDQPELWIDLSTLATDNSNLGAQANVQGTYTVIHYDYDYVNKVNINVYNDGGNNITWLPTNTEIEVIGWTNNKWGLGNTYFKIRYTDPGTNETETGWIKKNNVKLKAVAEQPAPDEKPTRPPDLGDNVVYLGDSGDFSTIFAWLKDNPNMVAQIYKLVDKDGKEFYVYCADNSIPANAGYTYTKTDITELANVETLKNNPDFLRLFGGYNEQDYIDAPDGEAKAAAINEAAEKAREALGKINAILKNGYQNGGDNLSFIQDKLKVSGVSADVADNVTEGIALTATQVAIWYTVHGEDMVDPEYNSELSMTKLLGYCYKEFSGYGRSSGATNNEPLADEEREALFATFKYLIELDADYTKDSVYTPKEVELKVDVVLKPADTVSVPKDQLEEARKESYSRDVLFTMSILSGEAISDELKGELMVTVSVAGVAQAPIKLSEVEKTDDGYIIRDIELRDGQKVDVAISNELTEQGNQGIYIFTATAGSSTSQTFAGTSGVGSDGQGASGVSASGSGSATFTITTTPDPDPKPDPKPDPDPGSDPDPEIKPDPEPKPDPEIKPDPEPKPDPEIKPDPEPKPEPKEPVKPRYPVELPDPNDPDSPDTVTIYDDGVPKTYMKVYDPETDEYVYILEEEVPLFGQFEVPQTGDSGCLPLTFGICALALAAIVLLLRQKPRKDN